MNETMMTMAMGFGISFAVGIAVSWEMAGGFKNLMKEVFGYEPKSIASDTKSDGSAGYYLANFGEMVD